VTFLAVKIRYWDKDSWVNYLKSDILPLYGSVLAILNLWKELRERTHGSLLSEVVKKTPSLEQIFVSGTSPPDKYEEDGLAFIYNRLLGTSVKLREYYFLKKLGKEPKTPCIVEKTDIVDYIDHISVLLERVVAHACEIGLLTQLEVQNAQESSKMSAEEILIEPVKILEKFVDFLNKALSLTIAYNEHTRFIWHLRKTPKKYLKEFYPELMKPEVFKFIQELLGLREYIVPQVEDSEIADLYTIYSFDYAVKTTTWVGRGIVDGMHFDRNIEVLFTGYLPPTYEPYKTIGGCLCRINELIWGLFSYCRDQLRLVVSDEVPDPLNEWSKMVINTPSPSSIPSTLDYPKSYEVLSVLDELLPSIFVGKLELIRGDDNLFVIRRLKP
jgi:hypothetical protein